MQISTLAGFLKSPQALPLYYAKPGMRFCNIHAIKDSIVYVRDVLSGGNLRIAGRDDYNYVVPYLVKVDQSDAVVVP